MTEDEIVGWHHRLNGQSLSRLWDLLMDREAWRAVVHGVTKSCTLLSDRTEKKYVQVLYKEKYEALMKDIKEVNK